jgi:enamine deaminase RidA (YjgF/YER057c/UK114 family)
LKDIGQIAEVNKVWDAWIPSVHTPPRVTVQAAMANPRWAVEIVVTAAALQN